MTEPRSAPHPAATRQALDYARDYLAFQQRYRRIPGLQVAVRLGSDLLLSEAWGDADVEAGVPLSTRHLIRIASHSKTFTATAILQLVQAGRLRLDDPAGSHVTALADAGSPLAAVTIRELLSHAGGITRDSADGDFWQLSRPFPDRAELLAVLSRPDSAILPASQRFKYSNIGYGLLGLVIEAVTGTGYADHVRRAIVAPLGLTDIGPELDAGRLPDYACGYSSLANGDRRVRIDHVDTRALAPATGWYATAEDLTAYFAAHLPGDDRLLTDGSKRLMRQALWEIDGSQHHRYGLGLALSEVGDRRLMGHGGSFPGHITASLVDPDARLVISVLTTAIDGPANDLARSVVRLLDLAWRSDSYSGGDSSGDGGSSGDSASDSTDSSSDSGGDGTGDGSRFAGRFAGLWGVTDVALLGGRLYLTDPTRSDPTEDCAPLDPVGDGEFRVAGGSGYGAFGERLRYRFADDGTVQSVRTAGGLTLVPERRWVMTGRFSIAGSRSGTAGPGAPTLAAAIESAPLVAAWSAFVGARPAPFTIPGHKRRAQSVSAVLGRILDADVPLYGGLDSVKLTGEVLAAAERLAATTWGASWCRFSTGGSTHANQAIALALGRPGDPVLVSRTAHRSTLLGLVASGLRPVWMGVDIDPSSGIPLGLGSDRLAAAAAEHPDAVAALCVEPGYVGTVSPVADLAEAAHRAGLPLVVDQAWGAHFGFHDGLPRHALQAGADAMVISVHKSLPAFSQASALLVAPGRREDAHGRNGHGASGRWGTDRWGTGRLERAFDAGNTTSPAGAILASIDATRALLAHPEGVALLGRLIAVVAGARDRLRSAGLDVVDPAAFPPGRYDPTKLVIRTRSIDRNGNDIEAELTRAGVPVEMADADTVIPMLSLLDDESTVSRLVTALTTAVARTPAVRRAPGAPGLLAMLAGWPAPEQALSPRDAFFADLTPVPGDRAAGRICGEVIAPYPPGIPALVPGELIDADRLEVLRDAAAAGTRIAYAADPTLATIQVVDEAR